MLEVEIDVFSGMSNPRFVLSEAEEQELLNRIITDPGQMSPLVHPTEILGLATPELSSGTSRPTWASGRSPSVRTIWRSPPNWRDLRAGSRPSFVWAPGRPARSRRRIGC